MCIETLQRLLRLGGHIYAAGTFKVYLVALEAVCTEMTTLTDLAG